MEAGELEVKKALEDVQVRNIKAVIEYTKASRELILEQGRQIDALRSQVQAQASLLNQFRVQLAGVQTKLFSGGTS